SCPYAPARARPTIRASPATAPVAAVAPARATRAERNDGGHRSAGAPDRARRRPRPGRIRAAPCRHPMPSWLRAAPAGTELRTGLHGDANLASASLHFEL